MDFVWIVIRAFSGTSVLACSTLLGRVMRLEIREAENLAGRLKVTFQKQSQFVSKVNDICVDNTRIFIGGLTEDAKGVTEIWSGF
jgi:hypothetical protein